MIFNDKYVEKRVFGLNPSKGYKHLVFVREVHVKMMNSKPIKIWNNYGLIIRLESSTISEANNFKLFTHDHVSAEWSFDSGHFKVLFIFVGAPVFSPFERSRLNFDSRFTVKARE